MAFDYGGHDYGGHDYGNITIYDDGYELIPYSGVNMNALFPEPCSLTYSTLEFTINVPPHEELVSKVNGYDDYFLSSGSLDLFEIASESGEVVIQFRISPGGTSYFHITGKDSQHSDMIEVGFIRYGNTYRFKIEIIDYKVKIYINNELLETENNHELELSSNTSLLFLQAQYLQRFILQIYDILIHTDEDLFNKGWDYWSYELQQSRTQ